MWIGVFFVLATNAIAAEEEERFELPFGFQFTTGYAFEYWQVGYEQDEFLNSQTTDSVTREPYQLFKVGFDLFDIFGFLTWHVLLQTDSVDGFRDLNGTVETGPGRGNTELRSAVQVPLGAITGPLTGGRVTVPIVQLQWAPTLRYYRWRFDVADPPGFYYDEDGQYVEEDGNVFFPARYNENRFGILLGSFGDEEAPRGDSGWIESSTIELSYFIMNLDSPMQFNYTDWANGDPGNRFDEDAMFITTNEFRGLYMRFTGAEEDIYSRWYPDRWGVSVWGDLYLGNTSFSNEVFETEPIFGIRNGYGLKAFRRIARVKDVDIRFSAEVYGNVYLYQDFDFTDISLYEEATLNRDIQARGFLGDTQTVPAGGSIGVDYFRTELFWGGAAQIRIAYR